MSSIKILQHGPSYHHILPWNGSSTLRRLLKHELPNQTNDGKYYITNYAQTWDIPKCSGDSIVFIIDHKRATSLNATSVSHFALSSSEPFAIVDLKYAYFIMSWDFTSWRTLPWLRHYQAFSKLFIKDVSGKEIIRTIETAG